MPLPERLTNDWKSLFAAHHPASRHVTLATRALDGGPAARIVVWRSFDPERCLLSFSANAASDKVAEMEAHPHVVLVAWDQHRHIQWRIACAVRGAFSSAWATRYPALAARPVLSVTREEAWKHHGRDAQMTFLWPDPGQPLREDPMASFKKRREEFAAAPARVPDGFAVIEGEIIEVDRLELTHPIHHRTRYRAADDWREEALTP